MKIKKDAALIFQQKFNVRLGKQKDVTKISKQAIKLPKRMTAYT